MTYALPDLSPIEVNPRQWEAQVQGAFFPLELSVDRAIPFMADVQVNQFVGFKIARVQTSAHAAAVSREKCRGLPQRFVKVIWQQRGDALLEQDGRALAVPAGSWTVYEASRSYKLQMSRDATFVAFLCEAAGHESLINLAQRSCGRALRTEGGAAIALSAVSALRAEGELVAPKSRVAVLDFVTSLLAQDLQAEEGGNAAARRRSQEVLLREARQYVRMHLDRQDLSPDQIAQALHVSRRTLYHAFELTGVTPQALVQQLRLDRCREILSHLGQEATSITQLALEFGFADPAYFARVFRQRFGQTPSHCRAVARSGQTVNA